MVLSPISTERLMLRPATPGDAETITPHCAEPRIFRMLTRMPPNQSLEDTRAFLAKTAADETTHVFTIWSQNAFSGLVSIEQQPIGTYALGYWSPVSAWGLGYMTEAASALRDAFVHETGVRVLQSGVFHDNPASRRILQKLGFLQAGWSEKYSLGRDCVERHADMVWVE